jgi:hypothetical protein
VLHAYPGRFLSIQKVDFRNFRFLYFDNAGKPSGGFFLKNGHYEEKEDFGRFSIDLESVHYLSKSPASSGESVLVLLLWDAAGGSSSQGMSAKVFTLSRSQLRVVQVIEWNVHFASDQPMQSFDAAKNELVIRSAHYVPGDAHCCVSAMDVVTLRWDGVRFVPVGIQTELSDYGKEAGKTLPRTLPR